MHLATELQLVELAEAIHRARNDLAAIASMLGLQARLSDNPAVTDALNTARSRVMAIARVNAALDNAARAEPTVDVVEFLIGMANDLQAAQAPTVTIMALKGPAVPLPISYARPLGLVANEWVTNALKYAFPGHRPGVITIALYAQGTECKLIVKDNGVGMDPEKAPQGTGLGTRLAKGLASQISGEIKVDVAAGGGTIWMLSFTKP